MLESNQSRVANMEAGDPSVSIDLLVHALFELGGIDRISHGVSPRRRNGAA